MTTTGRDILKLSLSPETKRAFEEGAQELNLSPEAYLAYLLLRLEPGVDTSRFDRHVREVFGKHGELMRRLAQ
jgi:hypothetical protein